MEWMIVSAYPRKATASRILDGSGKLFVSGSTRHINPTMILTVANTMNGTAGPVFLPCKNQLSVQRTRWMESIRRRISRLPNWRRWELKCLRCDRMWSRDPQQRSCCSSGIIQTCRNKRSRGCKRWRTCRTGNKPPDTRADLFHNNHSIHSSWDSFWNFVFQVLYGWLPEGTRPVAKQAMPPMKRLTLTVNRRPARPIK